MVLNGKTPLNWRYCLGTRDQNKAFLVLWPIQHHPSTHQNLPRNSSSRLSQYVPGKTLLETLPSEPFRDKKQLSFRCSHWDKCSTVWKDLMEHWHGDSGPKHEREKGKKHKTSIYRKFEVSKTMQLIFDLKGPFLSCELHYVFQVLCSWVPS